MTVAATTPTMGTATVSSSPSTSTSLEEETKAQPVPRHHHRHRRRRRTTTAPAAAAAFPTASAVGALLLLLLLSCVRTKTTTATTAAAASCAFSFHTGSGGRMAVHSNKNTIKNTSTRRIFEAMWVPRSSRSTATSSQTTTSFPTYMTTTTTAPDAYNRHLNDDDSQSPPSSSPSILGHAATAVAATAASAALAAATSAASSPAVVAASAAAQYYYSPYKDESWYVRHVRDRYEQALSIKCPFFRRRAADLLDGIDLTVRFLIIRHKSLLPSFLVPSALSSSSPPPGCWRSKSDEHTAKQQNLSQTEVLEILRSDWCSAGIIVGGGARVSVIGNNNNNNNQRGTPQKINKGYYITGKLTTSIYRDDCVFDGPDPDMPVRGLRKYLNAASQLFDPKHSYAELLSLEGEVERDNIDGNTMGDGTRNAATTSSSSRIVARWKMKGRLRLPWKPYTPEWTGSTTYYRDNDGLIYRHEETWDTSVLQAFLQTLLPDQPQPSLPRRTS
jgi:hypothetical protein